MKRFSGRKFSMKPNNKLLKYLGAFVLFIIGIYIVNYIFTVVMRPNMYEGLDINEVIKKYNKKESEKEGEKEGMSTSHGKLVCDTGYKNVKGKCVKI